MLSRLYLFLTDIINQRWENGRHTQQQAEDGPQSKWNVSSSEALDSSIDKPDLQWKGQCMHKTCNITTSRFSYRLSLLTRPIPSRSVQRHTIANTCTHSHENKLQIQIMTSIKVSCSNRTQFRETSCSYSIGWQGVVCNTPLEIILVLFKIYPIWS